MRSLFATLAFASLLAGALTPAMGQDPPADPRIVGSNVRPASDAQYGAVVAIYYRLADRETYICTGTMMTPSLILTAGHCGCGLPESYGVSPKQITQFNDPALLKIAGAPLLFDNRVCRDGYLGGGNDLALIRLLSPLSLASSDQPQQLANLLAGIGYFAEKFWDLRSKISKGTRLTVVGYGYTSSNVIGVREQADIPIYSVACEEPSLAAFCGPFSEMILGEGAGGGARTDTCGGDSGGPVFWTQNGRPQLIAVTSRAAPGLQGDSKRHCGGGGIYTLVNRASVQQWFEANGIPKAQ